MIRIFIADDHFIVREGFKRILSAHPDLELVGEAESSVELPQAVRASGAQVVLLDVNMPGPGILKTLEDLRAALPGVRVLALSVKPEEQYAVRMIQAGADGYVSKERTGSVLVEAIRTVHAGNTYVSPQAARMLAEVVRGVRTEPLERLSPREQQVLHALGQGRTTRDIANELGIRPKTVSTYCARLREKLGLPNNRALVKYAVERDIS